MCILHNSSQKFGELLETGDMEGHAETHIRHSFLSNFILGSQDGLVNVLGIILGVSAATSDVKLLFVAALAALGAESISMGAVAYTSTAARRKQYLKEVEREKKEMNDVPKTEKEEVRKIFKEWGYKGKELESLTNKIISNPKAWLEFMMAFELDLAPVKKSEPFMSFLVVILSTIFGSLMPILPFVFFYKNIHLGLEGSVIISAITLFLIGCYEAKTTVGSLWKSGLKILIIGLATGFAGYLIGHFIGAVPL